MTYATPGNLLNAALMGRTIQCTVFTKKRCVVVGDLRIRCVWRVVACVVRLVLSMRRLVRLVSIVRLFVIYVPWWQHGTQFHPAPTPTPS